MNVDDLIAERIAQARIRAEREKQRRAELVEARRKLRNLAAALDNTVPAASGA